jgi:hypothetical protein
VALLKIRRQWLLLEESQIFKSEHLEGLLSYKATIDLITLSKYWLKEQLKLV